MKKYLIVFLATGLFTLQTHAEDKPAAKPETQTVLKSQKDKISYSIGLEMGSGMKQQKLDVDPNLVVSGFRDGFSGNKGLLTEAEVKEVIEAFEQDLEVRMQK